MTCPIKRKIEIRPKFHQADMMGVIHNVEYFQWFEEGRLQIMLEILSMDEAMRLDIAMPVVENFCSYKCPSRFGDVLTLYTTHSRLDVYEGRLRFDHLLVNSNNRKEIASGHTVTTLIKMSTTRLLKEWSGELWERYQALR